MQQVDRRQVVLTWDPEVVAERFWFARDYLPEALERERGLPTVEAIAAALRGEHRVEVLAVPHDCRDGVFAG